MSAPRAPPGAHGGEGFVTGRVQEGQGLPVVLRLIRANVLRDAASLALGHSRLADGVQQGGLAVVDMPEDGDDGRARD